MIERAAVRITKRKPAGSFFVRVSGQGFLSLRGGWPGGARLPLAAVPERPSGRQAEARLKVINSFVSGP